MSPRGLLKRVMSPSSAISVAEASRPTPRSARSASTTGAKDHSGNAARYLPPNFRLASERRCSNVHAGR
jgi:hypothetical protein